MKDNGKIIRHEKCSIGNIYLRDDKVLMFKPFAGITTVTMYDLVEMYNINMDLTNGIPHLFYSDNTNMKKLGSEERVYISEKIHHFAIASAIKENSAIVRFITHSMVYLNKPQVPIKMFKTEENAINWLKTLDK